MAEASNKNYQNMDLPVNLAMRRWQNNSRVNYCWMAGTAMTTALTQNKKHSERAVVVGDVVAIRVRAALDAW